MLCKWGNSRPRSGGQMEPQEKKASQFLRFEGLGGILFAFFIVCSLPFLLGGCAPAAAEPTSTNTPEPSLTETLATEEPASTEAPTEAPTTATLAVGSPQPAE